MAKKIGLFLLSILLGGVFLLSGWLKLFPIEPFEYTFVDLGFINWKMAPFVARILIGLEFTIGLFLLLNLPLKKLTYKIAIGTLLFFCVYLLLLIIFVGSKGNCGCFGEMIPMTPLAALTKNIMMIGLIFILYRYNEGWEFPKKYSFITTLFSALTIVYPFIRNPIELDYSAAYLNQPKDHFELPMDSLYVDATLNVPPRTLSKGKHVIAFMSMTCPHCRIAAKKMRIIHERNPEIPIYFVLNGKDEKIKPFFDDTHSEDIDHCILNGRNFIYLAGTILPRIYLMNNSIVEHDVNYIDLDQGEIEKWLAK